MQKALAAVFTGHGDPFRLEEFPIPAPGTGETLVKITCSTICGSDMHTWHGRRQEPTPCVLGHEIVGTIAAFGPGSPRLDLRGEPLTEGDRITWTLAASCGECFFCKRGLPQKCEHLFKYGHSAIAPGREFSGGFAEYCLLTAGTGIIKLRAELSDALAAPANCAVATVAAATRISGNLEGQIVSVLGCGVLGLAACAMASEQGAAAIIACDVDPFREATARRFGATHFHTPDTLREGIATTSHGRGADISIELSGANTAVSAAIDNLRIGGTAVIAGAAAPCGCISLDPQMLVRRMVSIHGLHNYAPNDLVSAVGFLEQIQGKFPFSDLAGENFALTRIDEAFSSSGKRPGVRTAITP